MTFHEHLDECAQCRNYPFALCSVGEPLLRETVGWSAAPTQPTTADVFASMQAVFDAVKALPPVATRFHVRAVDDLSFLPKAPPTPVMGIPPGLSYPQGIPIHADPEMPYGVVKVVFSDGTIKTVRFAE